MIRKIPNDSRRFHFYNANPKSNRTNDCVIRAISTAKDKSWDEVFSELSRIAFEYKLMPNDKRCYEKYLNALGWHKEKQPRKDNNTKYTGEEFCDLIENPDCEYLLDYTGSLDCVIAHIGSHHTVCIKPYNETYKAYDIWNSCDGTIGNFWTKINS